MADAKFYLDTRNQKKDGTYPIKIYVRHRGKFLISTGLYSKNETWEGSGFSKKEPNYRVKNSTLRLIMSKVEDTLYDLERTGKIHTMTDNRLKEKIKDVIQGSEKGEKTFIDYLDEFVSRKTKEGTKTNYLTTKNKIAAFDKDCTFETMDKKWLENFERWMAGSGMKVNSYAIHLRNIRAIFNYCIDEEYTSLYPFRRFTIKKEETRKRSLTLEQLRLLRDYPCEEYQVRYRDMFFLMFYLIGINAADLFLAKKKDVVGGRLEYKRAKTNKLYSVFIQPEAWEIIRKYESNGEYLLNVMDYYTNYKDFLHRMNISLQQIGETSRSGLGGRKERNPLFPGISSYWSRHTWATMAAQLDISKDVISEALGHEYGCATTSIYIDFNQKKVDEANRKVIDYVNGFKFPFICS